MLLQPTAKLTPHAVCVWLFAIMLCACSAAKAVAEAPEYDPEGQTKCVVKKSQAEPLIIEWPATQRTKLEALAGRGSVAVRYNGCEMEVIASCKVPREYSYTATTRQRERVTIQDQDELYARLPLGAARLEGSLEKAGELNVSMTIVGTYETDRSKVHRDELRGDCGRATHVVDALIVGAFKFFAGAEAEIGASAEVGDVGGGAKSSSKTGMLRSAGDEDACAASTDSDSVPPDGCGALLRVEVATIAAARPRSFVADAPPRPSVEPPPKPPATQPSTQPTASAPAPKPASSASDEPESITLTPRHANRNRQRTSEPAFTPYQAGPGWGGEGGSSSWYWWVIGGAAGLAVIGVVIGSVVATGSSEEELPDGDGYGSVEVGFPALRW